MAPLSKSLDSEITSPDSASYQFGKAIRESSWDFEKDWINLNHGSYGSAPKVVVAAGRAYQDRSNRTPDRFMRVEYSTELLELREKLSNFVGCDLNDLVMNDKLLSISTTIYDACASSLQFIVDSHPHLNLSIVPIVASYPMTTKDLLSLIEETIQQENKQGNGKIKLALIDAISSMPAVIVPWEKVVLLLRKYEILSLIDGAHQIGQLPVNLRESQPDFWCSNAHKWLMGQRSCAVLYVSKPFQHLISSIPIGNTYSSRSPPPNLLEGTPEWVNDFNWNGTIDWSNFLSLLEVLRFRKLIGGEEKINDYCHKLAVEGGVLVAGILGTEVMNNEAKDDSLIANMVNIRLPIQCPSTSTPEGKSMIGLQKVFLYSTLMTEFHTQVPTFVHAGKWWVRFSAQVYNDLDEFKIVGNAVKILCDRINSGEYIQR